MQSCSPLFQGTGFPEDIYSYQFFIHPNPGFHPIATKRGNANHYCAIFGNRTPESVHCLMNFRSDELIGDQKLALLQTVEGARKWGSLNEIRQCVLCEQTFSGHEVRVLWNRSGKPRLRCPTKGCRAKPSQWIHPGNPLTSEDAWRDWVHLLDKLCDESAHC